MQIIFSLYTNTIKKKHLNKRNVYICLMSFENKQCHFFSIVFLFTIGCFFIYIYILCRLFRSTYSMMFSLEQSHREKWLTPWFRGTKVLLYYFFLTIFFSNKLLSCLNVIYINCFSSVSQIQVCSLKAPPSGWRCFCRLLTSPSHAQEFCVRAAPYTLFTV